MTTAWLFPGQGAQRVGMGQVALAEQPDLVAQANEILGYDIAAVCLEGMEPGLVDTAYVQPALFVVESLTARSHLDAGETPDVMAGHSLGEYAALYVAGSIDFATGVRLVQRRGALMSAARGGGMLAVVGADPASIESVLAAAGIDAVDLANRNSAEQVVLSGPEAELRSAALALREAEVGRSVPLRVSAPFHSRYMREAAEAFGQFLADQPIQPGRIPVISNVTARRHPEDPAQIRDLLRRQIASPVCWWESMGTLMAAGVETVCEIGPGRVLQDLWTAAQAAPPPRHGPAAAPPATPIRVRPDSGDSCLGSPELCDDYGIRLPYLAGSMYRGIASPDLVIRMGRHGLMGFLGTGGLSREEIEGGLDKIVSELGPDGAYGANLLASPEDPSREWRTVDILLDRGVRRVEAASFTAMTPALITFRFRGAEVVAGRAVTPQRVLAKVSRPEVARLFMSPPDAEVLASLVSDGHLTSVEATAARRLPVAGEVCVEADSGGHTDAGSPYSLMPRMTRLRDRLARELDLDEPVRIGAAGGIGSPEAAAAAFVLGAEFVVTGSINQCTPQSGTSALVKDMLQAMDVQDTAYAPAGDLFETGARVQVLRKGTLFPSRATKLQSLYRNHAGIHELDARTRSSLEERYYRRDLDDVWADVLRTHGHRPERIARAEADPRARMGLIFREYFVFSTVAAMDGVASERANFQVHTGPAMGAFNAVVADTPLEGWRARHVDRIAEVVMSGASALLQRRR